MSEEDRCEMCGKVVWGGGSRVELIELVGEAKNLEDVSVCIKKRCGCTPADKAIWKKLEEIEAKIEKIGVWGYWPYGYASWPPGDTGATADTGDTYTFTASDTKEKDEE